MRHWILLLGMIFIGSTTAWAEMPKVGKEAPDFTVKGDQGEEISLAKLRGKWVVLYFYPKDATPGCTLEALEFTQLYTEFQKIGAEVIGVSYDDDASHLEFRKQFKITYPLIADPKHQMAEWYGTAGEFFAHRETFLIDPAGFLYKIYLNVNPSGHAQLVLSDIKAAMASPKETKKIEKEESHIKK